MYTDSHLRLYLRNDRFKFGNIIMSASDLNSAEKKQYVTDSCLADDKKFWSRQN